jgi:hypothetical protein
VYKPSGSNNFVIEPTSGGTGSMFNITTSGNVGIGTSSPDRLLHAEASDAATATVTYTSRETHITSGTAGTGFGVGREWELENASGTNRVAATEEITWSDAVDATEDATYTLKLIRAGTLTEAFNVTSAGALTTSSTITSGNKITAGSGNSYDWASRSRMLSPSDGVITFYNNAATDFSRLQFGGTTSPFPSIKRNGAGLDIRLADDSGYASLSTGALTGFGSLTNYSSIETQSGGAFAFSSRSKLTSDVNGNLIISNNGVTDFGLLKFGGTTSSFPSLKRSSATLQVRLANDSAYAQISTGDVKIETAGHGLYIKEGTNATMGVATLVAGTVNVSTTEVTANSRIFLTHQNNSGTIGFVTISARTASTGFTITSSSVLDTSDIAWMIVEPA